MAAINSVISDIEKVLGKKFAGESGEAISHAAQSLFHGAHGDVQEALLNGANVDKLFSHDIGSGFHAGKNLGGYLQDTHAFSDVGNFNNLRKAAGADIPSPGIGPKIHRVNTDNIFPTNNGIPYARTQRQVEQEAEDFVDRHDRAQEILDARKQAKINKSAASADTQGKQKELEETFGGASFQQGDNIHPLNGTYHQEVAREQVHNEMQSRINKGGRVGTEHEVRRAVNDVLGDNFNPSSMPTAETMEKNVRDQMVNNIDNDWKAGIESKKKNSVESKSPSKNNGPTDYRDFVDKLNAKQSDKIKSDFAKMGAGFESGNMNKETEKLMGKYKVTNKEGMGKAQEDALKNVNNDNFMSKASYYKVPQKAAAFGGTAYLVSAMAGSKGQQSNAQLYGQQTPYSG